MGSPTELDVLKCNSIISPQLVEAAGKVWFVGNGNFLGGMGAIGASDGNDGQSPMRPFATLAKAVAMAATRRGDVIYLLPGHSESLIAVQTIAKDSLQIIGLGVGAQRPAFQFTGAIDGFDITGSGVRIRNLIFSISAGGVQTAKVNLTGTTNTVEGCTFYAGANDATLITLPGSGDYSKIYKNEFITIANGPQSAIVIEGATTTGTQIHNNYFDGNSTANAWDNGAIYSTVAHTNIWAQENTFRFGTGFNFTAAATGFLVWNYGGYPYVPGACEVLQPGGVGAGGAGAGVAVVPDSMGGAPGVSGTATCESTTGTVFYYHAGLGNDANDGLTPMAPKATLTGALAVCTNRKADVIIAMPGSVERTATVTTVNKEGVKIIGLSTGTLNQATIGAAGTFVGATAVVAIAATGVEIAGLRFDAPTVNTSADVANISITTGVDDVYLHDNLIRTGIAGGAEVTGIAFAGIAARVNIENNMFVSADVSATRAILAQGGVLTDCEIVGNIFNGPYATTPIGTDQLNVNLVIKNNFFKALAATTPAVISSGNTATGIVDGNYVMGNTAGWSFQVEGMQVTEDNFFNQDSTMSAKTEVSTTGAVFFVNSWTGHNNHSGRSPACPVATLDAAIGLCQAGRNDTIICMAGHAEDITAAGVSDVQIDVDVDGISILGLGNRLNRPRFKSSLAAPAAIMRIDADNTYISNIVLEPSATAVTCQMEIVTGHVYNHFHKVKFWQDLNEPVAVDFLGDSHYPLFTECDFHVTADAPTHGIRAVVGAVDDIIIKGCYFHGGGTVSSWDTGAIVSDQRVVGDIRDNFFIWAKATVPFITLSNAAATGTLVKNSFVEFSEGAAINTTGMVDRDNYYQSELDAVLKSGDPCTTGKLIFVNSGSITAAGDGLSPMQAVRTLDGAIALAVANSGDTIICMPGHSEVNNIATTTLDIAGISIVGLGAGLSVPYFNANCAGGAIVLFTVAENSVSLKNLRLGETTNAAATAHISVSNNTSGLKIDSCYFEQGQFDLESVIFAGTHSSGKITNNKWLLNAANSAADRSISNTVGVISDIVIDNNAFLCGNQAQAWDDAAIYSDQINTLMVVSNNYFDRIANAQMAIEYSAATTGTIYNNKICGGLAIALDPGSCLTSNNEWAYLGEPDSRMVPAPFYSPYNPKLGYKVTRAAAHSFTGVAVPIFTVTGPILLTHLSCTVLVANLDADACDLTFQSNPTVGTTTAMSAALAIISDELGTVYSITGVPVDLTTGGTGAGANAMISPVIVPAGGIEVLTTADMGAGGAIEAFELWYFPLVSGAIVNPV